MIPSSLHPSGIRLRQGYGGQATNFTYDQHGRILTKSQVTGTVTLGLDLPV